MDQTAAISALTAAYNPALEPSSPVAAAASGVGSFGAVIFEVGEQSLALVRGVRRTTSARIEEHAVTGGKPCLEFIGPQSDQTTFQVYWSRAFGRDPRAEIKKLREFCAEGTVAPLILGGENFGKHILVDVTEDWLISGPAGAPMVAEAALTLREYR